MAQPILVLVADAQPIWRRGVASLLSEESDLTLVGQAGDGPEAERLARELAPHVLLLGHSLPGLPAAELIAQLRRTCPTVRVLALMTSREQVQAPGLIAAGAAGCAPKEESEAALLSAIRAVARGEPWYSPRLLRALAAGERAPSLTRRQWEVLNLLARAWPNGRIAATLGVSDRTVRLHLRGICEKLSLGGRDELIAWAARQGLGDDGRSGFQCVSDA